MIHECDVCDQWPCRCPTVDEEPCRCQVAGEVDWRCRVHCTVELPADTIAVWESEGYR